MREHLLTFSILFIALCCSTLSWAENNKDGNKNQVDEGKKVTTILGDQYRVKTFLSAGQIAALVDKAEAGDSNTALKLAFYFEKPAFSQPDMAKSLHWMEKAHELGHPEAAFQLANHYQSGQHVPQDLHKALNYFADAAIREHSHAYRKIGIVLSASKQRLADYKVLANKFAKQDPDKAGLHLVLVARLFSGLKGFPKDLDFLLPAYEVAIALGSDEASYYYARRKWLKAGDNYDFEKAKPYIEPYLKSSRYEANEYAWVFCTSNNEQLRQPAFGLALMSSFDSLNNDFKYMDTLATCFAATGAYDKAQLLQQKIIDELKANHMPIDGYDERLALYQGQQAYIQPQKSEKEDDEKED